MVCSLAMLNAGVLFRGSVKMLVIKAREELAFRSQGDISQKNNVGGRGLRNTATGWVCMQI